MQLSGEDISLGDRCSQIAYAYAKKTFSNRGGSIGAPRQDLDGLFAQVIDCGAWQLALCSDGIGTKVELAERMQQYRTLGYDLAAMVVDDLVCVGAEPTTLTNTLDVDQLDPEVVSELMKGLQEAAGTANIAVAGGEIAELGGRIGGYGDKMHFNWCATAIGILPNVRQPINGSNIEVGDTVIALKSAGFRSNGFSLARRLLKETYGEAWHHNDSWGSKLLTPSILYATALVSLFREGAQPKGVAHVTGGGIAGNLARILKRGGHGAELEQLFPPHQPMLDLQELGGLADELIYRQWNMGNGMLLVVSPDEEEATLNHLALHEVKAQIAGRVVQQPEIVIHSLAKEKAVIRRPID